MGQFRLASMAVIPNDVRGRRYLPVGSQASSVLQQGRRKRLSGATQSNAPTPQPRPPRRDAHLLWVLNVPSRALSVTGMIGLLRPPSSCLAREHHQSSPSLFTCESGYMRSSVRRAWSRAAPSRSAHCLRFSVSSHCAEYRGVHGKLCARQ